MSNNNQETNEKKVVSGKPKSPFNNDPVNNRGGKSGNRGAAFVVGGGPKVKPNTSGARPKNSGGSGGDR